MKLLRPLLAAASLAALAACGGGGSTGTQPFNSPNGYCDPGTQVQLARPFNGQSGVGNTSVVEIVANGNSNQLYSSYANFQVVLVDQFGRTYGGGALTLTSDSSGPHPYASDYYYNSAFSGGLPGGTGFTAYLNAFQSGCSPIAIGNFST